MLIEVKEHVKALVKDSGFAILVKDDLQSFSKMICISSGNFPTDLDKIWGNGNRTIHRTCIIQGKEEGK